jgi:hypothetical protein
MTANIKLQVSVNSGAQQQGPVSGGIAVASNDVILMSGFNVSGAKRYRFEIFDYPPGFTTPSGWTQDPGTLPIYYEGPNPPSWSIPSNSLIWGKWGLSLIIDGGRRPSSSRPGLDEDAPDLRDESIVLVKAGPLYDGLFKETNQVDQKEQSVGDYKRNLRLLAALSVSAGGEANTASNVGTDGVGVFETKSGTDLEFRNIAQGDLILVQLVGTNIVVSINRDALLDLINTGSITIPPVGGDAVDGGDPLEDLRVIAVHSGGASGERLTIDAMVDGQIVARAGTGLTTIDWIRRIVGDPNGVENGAGGEFALSTDGRAWINAGGTVWHEVSIFGVAGGDLEGNYPDPAVIAVHMGGVRMPLGSITDGQFVRAVNGQLVGSTFSGGGGGASNGIPFTLDTSSTVMADPTSGKLRLNNATIGSVTAIALDHLDGNTINVESWEDALGASQGAVKGRLRLASASDSTRWAEFDVVTVTNQVAGSGGWQQLTVVFVNAGNALQTTANDTIVSFTRSGDPGSSGVPYTYDNSGTSATDPGNGKIRFSSATVSSITHLYVDLQDANGRDVTAYLDSLDDSTSTVKGYITLRRRTDPTAFALFQLTAASSPAGYRDFTVVHVNSGGSFVTTAADIFLQFSRTGDKGADGNLVDVVGPRYTFSTTVAAAADPGDGNFRFNAAVSGSSYSSVTAIYIDDLEVGGANLRAWFAQWDDSTSSHKGYLTLRSNSDPSKLVVFSVTALSQPTGYSNITLSHVASNGPLPTTAGDIQIAFSRTGDKGTDGNDGAPGAGGLTTVNFDDGTDGTLSGTTLTLKRRRSPFGPIAISTDQNDFNGGNSASWQDANNVELNPSADVNIWGFEAPTSTKESIKRIRNRSSSNYVTIKHYTASGGSSAANNLIICPGSTNFVLGYLNEEMWIEYDFVALGWRVLDRHVITANGKHTFKGNQSMGDNALLNTRTVEFNSAIPGAAGAGQSRAHAFAGSGGKSPGYLNARPADGRMLIDQCVGYVEDSGTGTSRSGTLALDFSNMMGRDLSNGAFLIKVIITSRCVTDSTSYPYIAAEAWFFYPGKGMGVTYMKQQGSTTRAYWTPSSTLSGSGQTTQATLDASKTGDTVNVAWAIAPGGAGSNTWESWIEARVTGGAP